MNILSFILKVYVVAALITAAVFSPAALSFVPFILLAWYLFQWIRPFSSTIDLLTQYFMFFAIALPLSPIIGAYFAVLAVLPLLILISLGLKKAALNMTVNRPRYKRNPTRISIAMGSISIAVLLLSVMVANTSLILASAIIIVYFIILGVFVFKRFPVKPVSEEVMQLRIMAGKKEDAGLKLDPAGKIGAIAVFEPEFDWVKVKTPAVYIKNKPVLLEISIAPMLSGPSAVKLRGYAVDEWGFMATSFEIEPIKLLVIPRARYATWLARKYMEGTKPGSLPLMSNVGITKTLQGLRQGVEFYGNRRYVPGDSMKNINWKSSARFNELISKEFTEFRGQPAVLLVNLVAGDAEELDKLAYNILVTAISLGQENIPGAMAVYDREKVIMATSILSSLQLVSLCMKIVKQMVVLANPQKYLNPPDISRLRTNISRISQIDSAPAGKLNELLNLEYRNLINDAHHSPCTRALLRVRSRISGQFSLLVLSQHNHDAEALAVNTYAHNRTGGAVIDVGK